MKVILARHTETAWNEQLRYIGRTNLSLSELGREHARMMATGLAEEPIGRVISSPMARAVETAAFLAADRELEVRIEPRFREIDFGRWEGLTYEEICTAYPAQIKAWIKGPTAINVPGGELFDEFMERGLEGWHEIERGVAERDGQAAGEKTLLLVIHAGCIKIILGELMGIDKSEYWQIHQDKGALNHLRVGAGKAEIVRINDIDYQQGI